MSRLSALLSPALLLLFVAATASPADPRRDADGDPLPDGALARLGTTRFRVPGHVESVALSPDGKLLAVTGTDDGVHVLDAATGKELRKGTDQEPAPATGIRQLEFAPDGKRLVGFDPSGHIQVWDPANGDCTGIIAAGKNSLIPCGFSADGKRLAAVNYPDAGANHAFVFDPATGKEIVSVELLHNQLTGAALSPDGKVLATAGHFAAPTPAEQAKQHEYNQTVQLWDVATGKELRRLRLRGGWSGGLSFSADGQWLAVAAAPYQVVVFDVGSGKELRRFAGRRGVGRTLAFAPEGTTLAAVSEDGTVHVWDAASGKRLGLCETPHGPVRLAFRPGKVLALTRDVQSVQIRDVLAEKTLTPDVGHHGSVTSLSFTSDGKGILSLGADGFACRWDAATGRPTDRVTLRNERMRNDITRFSGTWLLPDGRHALANDETTLRLYELGRGRELWALMSELGGQEATAVNISPDGRLLAFGVPDPQAGGRWLGPGLVHVLEMESGHELQWLKGHKARVAALAFAPDGKQLVSVGTSRRNVSELIAWDVRTGKPLWQSAATDAHAVAFSPDGRLLAVKDATRVTLWDAAAGRELRSLCRDSGDSIAFSPNGRLLLLTGHVGRTTSVRLYEVASGTLRHEFTDPAASVTAVAFALDGKRVATGHSDTTALVWDLTGGAVPKGAQGKPDAAELDKLWGALGDADAKVGFRAMRRLAQAPKESVALLEKHVKPAEIKTATGEAIKKLIAGLDADDFDAREKATKELAGLGAAAREPLRKALKADPSAEAKQRIEQLLAKLADKAGPSLDLVRLLRAVEVLEGVGTPGAKKVLQELAKGQAEAPLTEAAKAAVARLEAGAKK